MNLAETDFQLCFFSSLLDGQTGDDMGSTWVDHPDFVAGPAVIDEVVYGAFGDGRLVAVSLVSGDAIWWADQAEFFVSTASISAGAVFANSDDGQLFCFDAVTGAELWRAAFGAKWTSPIVADDLLYVTSGDGTVRAVDPKTGSAEWSFEVGGQISSSFLMDGLVFVSADDSYLFAIG